MINSILNYLRLALLGVAMAFLINPYYAHGSPGDADEDGITDAWDVCMENSYNDDYHEHCLEGAGFYLEYDYISLDHLKLQVWIEIEPLFTPASTILDEMLIAEIEAFEDLLNILVIDTFEEARIRTCNDLYEFGQRYYDIANNYALFAKWAIDMVNIIGILSIIPYVGPAVVAISALLLLEAWRAIKVAERYLKAGSSASLAYINLCGFRYDDPPWVG